MKYKNEIVLTVVLSLLIVTLKWINVLQIKNLFLMILFILGCSTLAVFLQQKLDKHYTQNEINYHNLDILKYVSAVLIIILHLRPFFNYSVSLDLAFNNIITRVCVPLFFVITGYFVGVKEKKYPEYIKQYISKTIPLYLVWSALYIPIIIEVAIRYYPTVQGYVDLVPLPLPMIILILLILSPIIIFISLIYSGVYYHLWYFPAVMLSLWTLKKWKERFQVKYLLLISFFLLLFGATETYYGVLPFSIRHLIDFYYKIFFTTRNFLFFGLFYIVLGYCMGQKEKLYSEHCISKLIVSMFCLVFEAIILQHFHRLNSNILLSCIPLTYYLFIFTLYITKQKEKRIHFSYREFSKYYYLVHPAIITLCFYVFKIISKQTDPYIQLVVVLFFTHITSYFFMFIKRRYPKLPI